MDDPEQLHLFGSGDTGDLYAETDVFGAVRLTIDCTRSTEWAGCVLERDRAEKLIAWLQSALAADRPSPP